jgi:hypothetical protein
MTRTKDDSTKPLLIGEAPSRSGDRYWMFQLSGAVAQTLCELAGIPPHPSGLNRMLNDPAERERCGRVLRDVMQLASMLVKT